MLCLNRLCDLVIVQPSRNMSQGALLFRPRVGWHHRIQGVAALLVPAVSLCTPQSASQLIDCHEILNGKAHPSGKKRLVSGLRMFHAHSLVSLPNRLSASFCISQPCSTSVSCSSLCKSDGTCKMGGITRAILMRLEKRLWGSKFWDKPRRQAG